VTERNLVEFHKIYDRIFLTQLTPEEEYAMAAPTRGHTARS